MNNVLLNALYGELDSATDGLRKIFREIGQRGFGGSQFTHIRSQHGDPRAYVDVAIQDMINARNYFDSVTEELEKAGGKRKTS